MLREITRRADRRQSMVEEFILYVLTYCWALLFAVCPLLFPGPNSFFREMERQWAELALLLVTKRLIGWLRREKSPRVTHLDGDKAAAAADEGDKGLPEVASLEESCLGMASRLAKLDPMHARFYAFVEQGGSVWRNNNHQLPQEKQEEVDGAADAVVGGIA